MAGLKPKSGHILTTKLEHPALLKPIEFSGQEIRYIPCDTHGAPHVEAIEASINENTSLIALSAVYSETGVALELDRVAELAASRNIPLIIDGVAILGKLPFTLHKGITAMAFSAHKIHGPKGVGVLYLRGDTEIPPLLLGGHQELGRRSGTENLQAILGMARALEICIPLDHIEDLRNLFESTLSQHLDISINGAGPRDPTTSNICFHGIDAETLLILLDKEGLCASQGSACSSGSLEPSRTLLEMGIAREKVKSSLRFSLSRYTTREEIERACTIICTTVSNLRTFV